MEFLLFSDFHGHNFKNYAKQVGGYNSRLLDSIAALQEVIVYANRNNIEYILFGGDLFHTRESIWTSVFNSVFNTIKEAFPIKFIMIPGNHDYGDREGYIHSVEPFDAMEHVTVIDWDSKDHIIPLQDGHLHCIPYTDSLDKAKESLSVVPPDNCVLLAHLGLQGALVGSDYVLYNDSDIQVKDVGYELYRCCFFGHFHEHQQVFRNGYYIGALTQHNWGDSGGRRGFVHARIGAKRNSIKHIETQAPKFITVKDGQAAKWRNVDFIKYVGTEVLGDDALKLLEEQFGDVSSFEIALKEEETRDIDLEVKSLDAMEVLKPWMEAHGQDDPDLLAVGKKLLASAREDSL